MRPIALDPPRPGEYDAVSLLDAPVARGGETTTVRAVVEEIAALLPSAAPGDPASESRRDPDGAEKERRSLARLLGDGHQAALGALLARTEQFCALCDVPVFSGACVVRVLPSASFPRLAFDFGHLLPACPACAAALGDGPPCGALAGDENAEAALAMYAWPHRFWRDAWEKPLLPFRYELVETGWAGGQPWRRAAVPERDFPAFREAYRRGDVEVRDGQVWVSVDGEARCVAVWAGATAGPGAEAVDAILGAAGQNRIVPAEEGDFVDRRMELRTLAFFRALDFAELLDRAWAEGGEDAHGEMAELLRDTVEGTGFWGVWLWVLRGRPDTQALLREVMDATAPTAWVYP